MATLRLTHREYEHLIADPFVGERIIDDEINLVLVVGTAPATLPSPGVLPIVVAQIGALIGDAGPDHADLVVDEQHLPGLAERVESNPVAATSLAVLLRQSERLSIEHGLAAESAVYSMLQAGAEFTRWRGPTEALPADEEGPVVVVDRAADELRIALDRPHRHNAITRQLRDELCSALSVGLADDSIRSVTLSGRGPSFCSGGDLAEFGSRPDPAIAHRTRLAQSPARLIHQLRERISIRIHGATLGGGIEMAAFAGRIIADSDTMIGLPEVGLGLIPGAGGTVGIPRRIGRQRTLALALAIHTIDADTALKWGLVDATQADAT